MVQSLWLLLLSPLLNSKHQSGSESCPLSFLYTEMKGGSFRHCRVTGFYLCLSDRELEKDRNDLLWQHRTCQVLICPGFDQNSSSIVSC